MFIQYAKPFFTRLLKQSTNIVVFETTNLISLPPPPPLACTAFSNTSLETNLVSLIRPSLQILGKTHTDVFPISGFLVNPL